MNVEQEVEAESETTVAFSTPFPNFKVREIVREIVTQIADTSKFVRFSPSEQQAFALGMVRGARVVAAAEGDDVADVFLAALLGKLNQKGVEGVVELIEVVTGPVKAAA